VRKATPLDVYGTLRPLLLNAQRRNLVLSLLNAACGTPAVGGLYTPSATIPSYDRAIFAGLSPARGAWYATINAGVAAQNGGATAATNGLSVAHLRLLKTYAIRGGASLEVESRIKPVQLKDKRGFPEELYIYLMDTPSYISLANDSNWTQFVYRGVVQNDNQPEGISGARYRGMVEGVMIYECPELNRYAITSGGFTSSWNLFLGAQAFGLCWAQRPWFEMEARDFNLKAAMAVCEIRGQKAFLFPSFQNTAVNVERGIIHSFVRTQ
jgi:hypothetical protein